VWQKEWPSEGDHILFHNNWGPQTPRWSIISDVVVRGNGMRPLIKGTRHRKGARPSSHLWSHSVPSESPIEKSQRNRYS
jgi:hypothetical protein